MKNILKFLGLFVSLCVVFSVVSGCSTATNSQKGTVEEKTSVNSTTDEGTSGTFKGKSSEYPPAPAAVLNTEIKKIDGSVFKVADLKGKVVLLNLWATWCGPCRQEMPHLVAMENEFKSKDFKIIGLNVDQESTDLIVPFAEKMKLNYDLAWADESVYRAMLKVSKNDGIPQSFLIDREGHLRGVFLGGSAKVIRDMQENVEKVVNE